MTRASTGFSGSGTTYLSGSSPLGDMDSSYTIFFWAYPTSVSTDNIVVSFGSGVTWAYYYSQPGGIDGRWDHYVNGYGGNFASTSEAFINTWSCTAITFNGGTGSGTEYIYYGDVTTTIASENSRTHNPGSNTNNLTLGRDSGSTYKFTGYLSQVFFYDTALTAAHLQEIQFSPTSFPNSNLYSYYPLFDNPENDWSNAGNNLTDTGTTAQTTGPPIHLFPGGC